MALSARAARCRRVVALLALALLGAVAGVARAAETLSENLREEVIYIDKPGPDGVKLRPRCSGRRATVRFR